MTRCTAARVDLAALEANFRAIGAYLKDEAGLNRGAGRGPVLPPGIIAVVKANAYGHGARPVAKTLEAAGATMLAVADIEEGVDLRASGIRAPILVFGALSVSDARRRGRRRRDAATRRSGCGRPGWLRRHGRRGRGGIRSLRR